MFTKALISVAALALSASAKPVASRQLGSAPGPVPVTVAPPSSSVSVNPGFTPMSFNGWGGFSSLDNFDSFFGASDFCGSETVQTVVQTEEVVCESVDITVIQQQLSIISEFAKRLVTTEICQVEVQTIVWSQFVAGFSSFSSDIRRESSRSIGFDSVIASHISSLVDENDVINTSDFGFSGSDIGSNLICPSGSNWIEGSSETSVQSAFVASQIATIQSSASFSSSSIGSFGGIGGVFDASAF